MFKISLSYFTYYSHHTFTVDIGKTKYKNAIKYSILCLDSNLNFQSHILHKLAILSSIIFLLKKFSFFGYINYNYRQPTMDQLIIFLEFKLKKLKIQNT